MEISTGNDGWVEIRGPISRPQHLSSAVPNNAEKIRIGDLRFFSGGLAAGLSSCNSLRELWIWCDVGRKAVAQILQLPSVEKLDLLCVRSPGGKMPSFKGADKLRVFRCNNFMNESDLLAISTSESLMELGAQSSRVSSRAVDAITSMPSLESVDFEGADFDDEMAEIISRSNRLTSLDIGASKLTAIGFQSVCQMKQLRSLDVWATNICDADLPLLDNLTNLEYLSVGGYEDQEKITSAGILPVIERLPELKRLWVDGVKLQTAEADSLKEKYEYFRN